MFDDIMKGKIEITMYVIIVSKKHQIIQQYKKQPKKSDKKIFFDDFSNFDDISIFYDVIIMNDNLHKQRYV